MIVNLRKVLKQDDAVLFIGSGVSLWSGLPTWTGLIKELIIYLESFGIDTALVRNELARGDLLQAASYGFDKLTKPQISSFIRNSCRVGTAKPHDIHKKIISLGSSCFITTNYDNLLELSFQKWLPDIYFRNVTNNKLTETAEIVGAKASHFLFKLHGDAEDSESIILTREQYRALNVGGDLHHALETVKTLMVSRPIIYIGFGLRDPDFLYLRDLLMNTYKGGNRDHYAIMPDVSDQEKDYWRRNFGIHLVSYKTFEGVDKVRDHSALLGMLDELAGDDIKEAKISNFEPKNPSTLLSLARYALATARMQKVTSEFEIKVRTDTARKRRYRDRRDEYENKPISYLLENNTKLVVLIGGPGAGKSYSLKKAAAVLAERLHQNCLSDTNEKVKMTIPLIADMKLYTGDLLKLIDESLPIDLPYSEIIQHFNIKIFIDSFNEMPREYWENGSYEEDFNKFINNIGDKALVISSRTIDGLEKLKFPVYYLDNIDRKTVIQELEKNHIVVEGRFKSEILSLLSRPFYFHYLITGKVLLPENANPIDFYRIFFQKVLASFEIKFGFKFELSKALAIAAYNTLNKGEETLPVSDLLKAIDKFIQARLDSIDVVNWLVAQSVLIPFSGGRIAFVHQSITEYLAAKQLADLYLVDPRELDKKLVLMRWDQALFLTISLLPEKDSEKFLSEIISADFSLALRASKYLEWNREKIVKTLLEQVPARMKFDDREDSNLLYAVEQLLELSEVHESQIRKLLAFRGRLSAISAKSLIQRNGDSVKDEMLQLIFEKTDDYNFCSTVGRSIKSFATTDDIKKINSFLSKLNREIRDSEDDKLGGFTTGMGSFLSNLDPTDLMKHFFSNAQLNAGSKVAAEIVTKAIWERASNETLSIAIELFDLGFSSALRNVNISKDNKNTNETSWQKFTTNHIDKIVTLVENKHERHWAVDALSAICKKRSDLADYLDSISSNKSGVEKLTLLRCTRHEDSSAVFEFMTEFLDLEESKRALSRIEMLKGFDLDWHGQETLFLRLLMLRDLRVLQALMPNVLPPHFRNLDRVHFQDLTWWIMWISELFLDDKTAWLGLQLGAILGIYSSEDFKSDIMKELNEVNQMTFSILYRHIVIHLGEISVDDIKEEAIDVMISDLNKASHYEIFDHLLATASTDSFINNRLLPLLDVAEGEFLARLKKVIRRAGLRHGKRYILGV